MQANDPNETKKRRARTVATFLFASLHPAIFGRRQKNPRHYCSNDSCRAPIPPGRPGRRCKVCRARDNVAGLE